MCVIAGYSGNRPAAPILLEMMRRIEYVDGGYATGIATVHDGKIYYAKAIGDVEMLVRTTNALELPGTVGIIHTRPSGEYFSNTHPYFDASGKLALVENGTPGPTTCPEQIAAFCEIMNEMLDRGIVAPSAYDLRPQKHRNYYTKDGKPFYYIEAYSHLMGDLVKDTPRDQLKVALAAAAKRVHERLPADNITATVHADLADTITVATVTRPMSVLSADGETYMASLAMAFPDELQHLPVVHLPQCSVSQITPRGLQILSTQMEGVRSETVTDDVVRYYKEVLERELSGRRDDPLSILDIPCPMDIWSAPRVDCRYVCEGRDLKPARFAIYQAMWELHREGRLHSRLGVVYGRDFPVWPETDCYFTKFWID